MYENDLFCEIVEAFREQVRSGVCADNIAHKLRLKYECGIGESIVLLAIAECLWRVGKLTQKDIDSVERIISSESDLNYWKELGADDIFIEKRRIELELFLDRLSQSPTKTQKWILNYPEVFLQKGSCFWYIHRGKIYSVLIVETLQTTVDYFLVAISQEMDAIPQAVSEILASSIYTVAWFSNATLLSPKRLHYIGQVDIKGSYRNKYGIVVEYGRSIHINNCGQARTWTHTFREYSNENMRLKDFVD